MKDMAVDIDAVLEGMRYALHNLEMATDAEEAVLQARTVYQQSSVAPNTFKFADVMDAISARMPKPTPAQMKFLACNEGDDTVYVSAALGAYGRDVVFVTKILKKTIIGNIDKVEFSVCECGPNHIFKLPAWDITRPEHRPKQVINT